MECYCDARNKPMRCEITKPQTASVISLWFWGLLAYPELYCEWPEHNQHSRKFSGVHGFLSLTVSPTKGVKGDPRRLQRSSIFPPPTPHPPSLVITRVKKSPKITSSPISPYSYNISFSPFSLHFRPEFSLLPNFSGHFSLLPIVYLSPLLACRVGYHTSKPIESVVYCLRLV